MGQICRRQHADEPTGELDSVTSRAILQFMREIVDSTGITLIVATHDRAVRHYADAIYEMSDGQLAEQHMAGAHGHPHPTT